MNSGLTVMLWLYCIQVFI